MITARLRPTSQGIVCSSYGFFDRRSCWTKIERHERDLTDAEMDCLASTLKTTAIPRRAFVPPSNMQGYDVMFDKTN